MQIDPRLNDIDDCLYRVAARALIVQDDKVLLIREVTDAWWAFPGGGVDHGETIAHALVREIEEELGVPTQAITSDFQITHHNIGKVINGVPRMNIYFKASFPENLIEKTSHVAKWGWFTKNEFLKLDLSPSYDKTELADIIFTE